MTEDDIARQTIPVQKVDQLTDISVDGPRLIDMNAHGISLQVVSHAPMAIDLESDPNAQATPVEECHQSNNELAEKISTKDMASRFRGFARLPMHEPEAAARELRRCVTELGFVGSLVDNTLSSPSPVTKSVFYDEPAYDVFWQTCCDLDVPFYLHPCYPPTGPATSQYRFDAPSEGFGKFTSTALATFGFGWHIDTSVHLLRLFATGIFDRFPRLKFVIGHFGESLPFFLERSAHVLRLTQPNLKRDLMQVWRENVWIASSGFWGEAPVAAALRVTSPERILFSVDWPFSSNEQGTKYMEWLWGSGLVTPDQWEGIAFRNSLKLFGWAEDQLQKA